MMEKQIGENCMTSSYMIQQNDMQQTKVKQGLTTIRI